MTSDTLYTFQLKIYQNCSDHDKNATITAPQSPCVLILTQRTSNFNTINTGWLSV